MRAGRRRAGRSVAVLHRLRSAITTINAAIFTGARTNFAMGRDYPMFRMLGDWREKGSTPANALFAAGRRLLFC